MVAARSRVVVAFFVVLTAVTLVLGAIGVHQYLVDVGGDASPFNVALGTLSLFGGGSLLTSGDVPPALEFAQISAPIVTVFAAFELFRSRIAASFRRWRARHRRSHVVLIGLGRTGKIIAEQLWYGGEQVVVAIDEHLPPDPKYYARSRWAALRGDARDSRVLQSAGVPAASIVHIATGGDGVDIEIAESVRRLVQGQSRTTPLNVKVQLDSPSLAGRLQQVELERIRTDDEAAVEYVNLRMLAATAVLEFVTSRCLPTDHDPSRPPTDEVIVIGDNHLARAVASLAERSHRARRMLELPPLSVITPRLLSVDDIESADTPEQQPAQTRPWTRVLIVCLDESRDTIDLAARLCALKPSDKVFGLCEAGRREVVSAARADAGELVLVDPNHLVQTPEVLTHGPIELMARLIHADYLRTSGDSTSPGMVPWSMLPETFRQASRSQATDFGNKLARLGCELSSVRDDGVILTDEEVHALAAAEHDRWSAERRSKGWVYGSQRDDQRLHHPDLVDYAELDPGAQAKDERAVRRLPALAALLGLTVVRKSE